MAILEASLLKGLKGKLGNLVFYEVNGSTRVRQCTGNYRDKKSTSQLRQRSCMKLVGDLYHQLGFVVLSHWKAFCKGTGVSAYALFLKKNIHIFNAEGGISDYSKLCVMVGGLQLPDNIVAEKQENGQVKLSWQDNSGLTVARPNDRLVVVVYSPEKKIAIYPLADVTGIRSDGRAVFNVPGAEDCPAWLYCYFQSPTGDVCSESKYLLEV